MTWQELAARCYVPYSKQPAYCVVESKNGFLFPGVRIENIAFPDTISEIQSALFSCLSEGYQPELLYMPSKISMSTDVWVNEYDLKVQVAPEIPDKPFFDVIKDAPVSELERLKQLLGAARAGYSDFPVSAILYTTNGVFEGVNIEVSNWSLGLCAERVALAKAISAGYINFTKLSVHTRYGEFSSPCGACRQVLCEHMSEQFVELHHADGTNSAHRLQDLLPFRFSSDRLTNRTQ